MSHFQRFNEYVKFRNISQKDLAIAAKVSKAQVSKYLKGNAQNPTMNFFVGIAESCDISLEWWILGRGEMIYENKFSSYIDPVRYEKLKNQHFISSESQ